MRDDWRGKACLDHFPENFLLGLTTRFLKIIVNFCYLESEYLAEIIISTGVPDPLLLRFRV